MTTADYALDVKFKDENEIFHLSYNTKWNDISLMLRLKYEIDDSHWFSFTDKDDLMKIINDQSNFDEALKNCKSNFDVLNIQVWPAHKLKSDLNKPHQEQTPASENSDVDGGQTDQRPSSQYLIVAGKAIGGIGNLASGVVKSAFNHFSPTAAGPCENINNGEEMQEIPSTSKTVEQSSNVDSVQPEKQQQQQQQQEDEKTQQQQQNEQENSKVKLEKSKLVKKQQVDASTTTTKINHFTSNESDQLVERIRQEVQSAVRNELQLIREELVQLVVSKQQDAVEVSATQARSLMAMKDDLKLLKQELILGKGNNRRYDDSLDESDNGSNISSRHSALDRDMTVCVICENLTSPTHVEAGEEFEKCWVLKNNGNKPWLPGITMKLVDEEPDSRFDRKNGKGGRDIWRVFPTVPPLECGGVTAVSIVHTAPHFPGSYVTTWSLCVGSHMVGPLFRSEVVVVGKKANEQQPSSWKQCSEQHESFTQLSATLHHSSVELDDEDDDDHISHSRLSSFQLNDDASDVSVVESTTSNNSNKQQNTQQQEEQASHSVKTSPSIQVVNDDDNTPSCSGISNTNSMSDIDKKSSEDEGESSDFEVIPIPSCFDLSRPYKTPQEHEDKADESSLETLSDDKVAAKQQQQETKEEEKKTSGGSDSDLVEATPASTLSQLSESDSSISIISAPPSVFTSVTNSSTQEQKQEEENTTTETVEKATTSNEPGCSNSLKRTKKIGIKDKPLPVPDSVLDQDKPYPLPHQEPPRPAVHRKVSPKKSSSRPVDGKEVVKTKVKSKIKTSPKQEQSKYADKIHTLKEMGFTDAQLNRHLLDQFNGNLHNVVEALVTHLSGEFNEDGLVPPAHLGSSRPDSFMV